VSRPSFLADQDFNEAVLEGVLRTEPSIQIMRLREVGLRKSDDASVLEWAAQRNLIVLSHDVNTMSKEALERLSRGERMTGLLLVRQQPIAFRAVIDNLVLIWTASEAEEWQNQVTFLPF
jgi:hypothetical protein